MQIYSEHGQIIHQVDSPSISAAVVAQAHLVWIPLGLINYYKYITLWCMVIIQWL